MIKEDKIALWLVTTPNGSHFIMATLSVGVPQRCKMEDEDTHEQYDAWDVDNCIFIYPVENVHLPHYLIRHSWDDDPIAMIPTFFAANTNDVTCKIYPTRERCWRFNHTKTLLSCSRCLGSSCQRLKANKTVVRPAIDEKSSLRKLGIEKPV